jgi:Ser/Thr protein kinase RdoA (MazF antagonist)
MRVAVGEVPHDESHRSGHVDLFPVVNSLASPDALLREITARYELDTPTNCFFFNPGVNDTYLISTAQRNYILRVYRAGLRSESAIAYELEHLQHLKQKGIGVAGPHVQTNGQLMFSLQAPEGMRYAALFDYAVGLELEHTPEQTHVYGQTLAQIHNVTDSFYGQHQRAALDLEHLLDAPLRSVEPFLAHRLDDWQYLQRVAELLSQKVAQVPADQWDIGFCHGDAHGQNAHIDDKGQLQFFDFDCCGQGWRAYDIAVFRWGPVGREDDAWNTFLAGYKSARPLAALEEESVPIFVALRHIWLWGLHTSNAYVWGRGWMNDDYFDGGMAGGFAFLREWMAKYFDQSLA